MNKQNDVKRRASKPSIPKRSLETRENALNNRLVDIQSHRLFDALIPASSRGEKDLLGGFLNILLTLFGRDIVAFVIAGIDLTGTTDASCGLRHHFQPMRYPPGRACNHEHNCEHFFWNFQGFIDNA